MKPKLCAFVAVVSSAISLSLGASEEVTSKVELGQGYRQDSLKWSIAGPHNKPNVISELDYKNLHVYLSTLKASLSNGTYIGMLELAYGDILSGKVRDSDYKRDNRRGEFSRSRSEVPGDYTVDATAKIGRIIPFSSGITFTPSIGYGAFWQNLRMKNGHQIIPKTKNDHYLRGLNSTYKARWSAPFAELRMSAPLSSSLTFDAGYTLFYPVQYTGKGHWNLRHLHFTQKNKAAKSFGQKVDLGLRWACTERVELGLGCGLSKFDAKDGSIKFNGPKTKGSQPAHRAQRTCIDYLVTLSYAF